jgi:hypothetical protein
MNTLSKEQLIECFKYVLKQQGFKKTKTTWRKTTDDLVFVLNVQGSQRSSEDYYINVAIYIKALGTEENPAEYRCHIRDRIDHDKPFETIHKEVLDWFERHGDIERLRALKQQNNLPLTTVDAQEYLDEK